MLRRAPLLQEIQELAASVVEPLDHAPVVCDRQRRRCPAVPGQKPLRGRVRVVRHHGRVPDHPRSVLLFGEGHEVFDGLHRDPAYLQPSVSMPVASGHSVGEAASRIVVLPPLTTLEAQVPLVAEESGQGGGLLKERRQSLAPGPVGVAAVEVRRRLAGRSGRIVADDAMLVRVSAGDERGEAGATQARRNVPPREAQRTGRQTVEVGCADRGMPHEAVVRPSLVVGDDEQDIGPLRSGRGRSLEEGGQEPAQKEERGDRGPEVLPN